MTHTTETDTPAETLAERDARLYEWLAGISPGDIVTVRLNSTDTLTGKVYEAPDSSQRTALYVSTTLLRHGNGYPGGAFEPVTDSTDYDALIGRVASAISNPRLEPEHGVHPWGEHARRVVEVVILPILAEFQALADELDSAEIAGLRDHHSGDLQRIIDGHLTRVTPPASSAPTPEDA